MEFLRVIYNRFFVDFQAPNADLSGRVCLVTGSNTGIGYEAALHLAKRNPSILVLGVRSISKGQAAAESIYRQCTTFRGRIEVWELDMARFDSVISFGKKCKADLPRLDIAILNAAVGSAKYAQTSDTWEINLQVNVLSTGLLGFILLPKLRQTASEKDAQSGSPLKPHLTIVSSDAQYTAAFKCRHAPGQLLIALNDPENFSMIDTYNTSKLLVMFLVRELAALPIATNVIVNAVNPGMTVSGLKKDLPWIVRVISDALAWSAEKGSRNYIYAAFTDTPPAAFINCCKERAPAGQVTSSDGQRIQKKFWIEIQELYQRLLSD
ncbi:MAG: hypothetical protein ASARMPRED_001052 [Alectoria sarmentosa]|nr:MAG: hypothetical protein ASARMPRED_001052 [Alectoria sarmentosa]